MKKLYYLALTCLALFACSGPRGDNAGIINGNKILYPDYIRSLQGHTVEFQSYHRRAPDQEEKKQIFKDTWQDIAMHVILKDYYQKYHITTNEKEVLDTLQNNIPDVFKNAEVFKRDGVFDADLYYQALRYDSPLNMTDVRRHYYEYYVPNQKLKPLLIEKELMDKKTRQELTQILSTQADFDLLVFDPQFIGLAINEQELRNYYQQNMEKYALNPLFHLEYFSLPLQLKEQDLSFTKAVADSIQQELSEGISLEKSMQSRREWLHGLKIEDSGFVRLENIEPDLLFVIENLADDAYSGLIQRDNGYYIFQKLQRSKSMIRYRSLLIPPNVSDTTIKSEYNKAIGAMELAKNIGVLEAAQELELVYHDSGSLYPGEEWHPDSLVLASVENRLMNHKKGDFLDPIYSPATGSWLIIYLRENQVNRARPFAEVKRDIEAEILQGRQQELSRQKANAWLNLHPDLQIQDSEDFKHLRYTKAGVDAKYEDLSLEKVYLKARLDKALNKKARVHQIDQISFILIPRKVYASSDKNVDFATLRQQYQKTLEPDWFEEWVASKLNSAKLEIFVQP